jgi:tetratricopeptide (TPR) repeat protein
MAANYGQKLDPIAHWRPLLRFTRGNPLTVTVVVGQALREGRTSEKALQTYVQQLRAGEAAFADEAAEGRTRSLGASLAYGFEHSFSAEERARLALLALFQGVVDAIVLGYMGYPDNDWHLPTIRGIEREEWERLLDRAAEVGLLTAYGGGYYGIHPALPWFFRSLFEECYPPREESADAGDVSAIGYRLSAMPIRAFVEAMGELGGHYANQYNRGNRSVITNLSAEEDNLLHARRLARTHGWWDALTSTMQGLQMLYHHTGRRDEWARLVEEIVPDFVDPASDGPLPGREEQWSLVTGYRVRLAMETLDWERAARLQHARVEWDRQRATPLRERPADTLSSSERNTLRSLAVSLGQLGDIQRQQGSAECAASYEEAIIIRQQIGDTAGEAINAFNLGHAYLTIPALRDLDAAERWYRRSLELRAEGDNFYKATSLGQLGYVAWERFTEAKAAGKEKAVLVEHLNAALKFYQQALAMIPPDAVNDLAAIHNQLGNIYRDAEKMDAALHHYREAIRYEEMQGNHYGAAKTRYNVALTLRDMGNLDDALLYARAAVEGFARYGAGAADMVALAERLVGEIEGEMGEGGGEPIPEPDEEQFAQFLASLPAPLRQAIEQQNMVAFQQALAALSPAEQQSVLAALQKLQGGG